MPYNNTGAFTIAQPNFVAGTTIASAAMNSDLNDIAVNGLSNCVTADGQQTITGQIRFASGTASIPGISFTADGTTGLYYIGANHLGFAMGGVEGIAINYNNFGSGQSGNIIEQLSPTGTVYPGAVGTMMDFAGSTAPLGWLLCFGQVLNISAYPELGGLLGATYGGNGSTTFGVPDCRGRATYGQDNMGGTAANRITATLNYDGTVLGNSGGAQNHTLSSGEMPSHSHANFLTDPGHTHTVNNPAVITGGSQQLLFNSVGLGTVTITMNHATTGYVITNVNAGSGTAYTVLGPSIIFNKIIFAGRQ